MWPHLKLLYLQYLFSNKLTFWGISSSSYALGIGGGSSYNLTCNDHNNIHTLQGTQRFSVSLVWRMDTAFTNILLPTCRPPPAHLYDDEGWWFVSVELALVPRSKQWRETDGSEIRIRGVPHCLLSSLGHSHYSETAGKSDPPSHDALSVLKFSVRVERVPPLSWGQKNRQVKVTRYSAGGGEV